MSTTTLFHFVENQHSFEDLVVDDGTETGAYWKESDVREAMGYTGSAPFRKVIMRAMQACLSVGVMPDDNFKRVGDEYHLTRFGCYLVAMNGDAKKPQVAAAQIFFAALAATYASYAEHADGIDRIVIREEVRAGEKSLASTAKRHKIDKKGYGIFLDAGYRGMYNMSLKELKRHKGLKPNATAADHMGRAELAAHLFRITQTDERIRQHDIEGQQLLESAAMTVGANVRQLVIENTGQAPENLPTAEPIQRVRTKIKGSRKNLEKLDG